MLGLRQPRGKSLVMPTDEPPGHYAGNTNVRIAEEEQEGQEVMSREVCALYTKRFHQLNKNRALSSHVLFCLH